MWGRLSDRIQTKLGSAFDYYGFLDFVGLASNSFLREVMIWCSDLLRWYLFMCDVEDVGLIAAA